MSFKDIKENVAIATLVGFPPLGTRGAISFANDKKNVSDISVTPQTLITPLCVGAIWLGVSFAIKRDIKFASIIGGAIAGCLYAFWALDVCA